MVLSFVFAALVVLLDQLFKRLIIITLYAGGEIVLIPQVLGLIYVRNYGAAFGIFQDMRWPLAGVQLVLCILLALVLLRYNTGFWGKLGLAAFLGGGVGNLIDRVFRGYVVDMFELQFVNFAIFNIADIFITLGGITFFIHFLLSGKQKEQLDDAPRKVIGFPSAYVEEDEPEVEDFEDLEDILSEAQQTVTPDAAVQQNTSVSAPAPKAAASNLMDFEAIDHSGISVSEEEYDLNKILREYGLESDDN